MNRVNPKNNNKKHWTEILVQAKILEKQGYKVVPITNVIPDIIAIQGDNIRVFAVEVERGKPNHHKYTDDIKKWFDDIIWILLRKTVKIIKQKELEK